jgi:hypothetical protein
MKKRIPGFDHVKDTFTTHLGYTLETLSAVYIPGGTSESLIYSPYRVQDAFLCVRSQLYAILRVQEMIMRGDFEVQRSQVARKESHLPDS